MAVLWLSYCRSGSTQVVIVASQVLAGHLGTTALAAAALGNMLWLVGYYAIIGTCTALETRGAQVRGMHTLGNVNWPGPSTGEVGYIH